MKKVLIVLSSFFFFACCHFSYVPSFSSTIYQSTGKIVVYAPLENGTEKAIGGGTGFAIGKNEILTANHICSTTDVGLKLRLQYYNGFGEVEVPGILIPIKRDKDKDLCVLFAFNNPLKPISFAKKWPKPGDKVFVFGAPLHEAYILTEGYYSHNMYIHIGRNNRIWVAAMSVPSFAGNSGSPVLNEKGEFIGVLIAGSDEYPHITFTPSYGDLRNFLKR